MHIRTGEIIFDGDAASHDRSEVELSALRFEPADQLILELGRFFVFCRGIVADLDQPRAVMD